MTIEKFIHFARSKKGTTQSVLPTASDEILTIIYHDWIKINHKFIADNISNIFDVYYFIHLSAGVTSFQKLIDTLKDSGELRIVGLTQNNDTIIFTYFKKEITFVAN